PIGNGGTLGRFPTSSGAGGRRASSGEASPSRRAEPARSCHRVSGRGFVLREVGRERLAIALLLYAIDEGVERDPALLVPRAAATDRYRPRGGLLISDDEHVVRLALLRFLHAVAQVAGLLVEMDAEVFGPQLLRDIARVIQRRFAYRDDRDLLPVEQQREVPAVMLDQTADETLETSKENAVDHYGTLTLALVVHERNVEALGQVEVHLHRRALPLAADRIVDLYVDLWRVEDAP